MGTLLVIALVVAAGMALCAGPILGRYADQRRLGRGCRERGVLVLTYDDGPGPATTPALLAHLARLGVRASFFALGSRAESAPQVLDRAVAEGHEVGSHSYGHVHAWRSLPWTSAADVRRGFRTLARWIPERGLFRAPYGKVTPFTWAAARLGRVRFAWWTIDSGDTWDELPAAESVVAAVRDARGGVVLLHDFDREADRAGYVLDLTERLVRTAREDGLRVMTMGALLDELSGPPAARTS